MIIDRIDRALMYRKLGPRMAAAFDALLKGEITQRPDGRYLLDGENLVAILMTYPTKPLADGRWEAHRKYIDIQVMLSGAELMDWAPLEEMKVSEPYSAEKDVEFFTGRGRGAVRVEAGMFAVFYPADAHMPSLMTSDGPEPVRKLVFKVAVA